MNPISALVARDSQGARADARDATGLCRRRDHLAGPRKAPAYLRSSVLNGRRSALRRKARTGGPCSRRCGGSRTGSAKCYIDPQWRANESPPAEPVTQGFGEFSAATGKLITVLGAWRAPVLTPESGVSVIAYPYLLWASPDASILIGEAGGHTFVVRDGHRRRFRGPRPSARR